MLTLTDGNITWLTNTVNRLKGSVRRIFMAETVQQLGPGGASIAEEKLGWNRGTIRKGQYELETDPIEDNFSARGRNKSEELFPYLLDDIKKLLSRGVKRIPLLIPVDYIPG